jgi:Carboxypeptidase regulatory-like domain
MQAMTPPQVPQASSGDPVDLVAGSVEIRDVEDWLHGWVESVDPQAKVSIAPPKETASGRGVALHLIELARNPPLRSTAAPALQLQVGYSVTTWAEEPLVAGRLLVDLGLDALGQTAVDVDFTPRDPQFWVALKVAPRPSFTIRLPVRRVPPAADTKRVRFPLVLTSARRMVVAGVVRGPQDTPLSGALVELVGLDRATRTDRSGHFAFAGVPQTDAGIRLRVRAKGVELHVPVRGDKAEASELSIQLDL